MNLLIPNRIKRIPLNPARSPLPIRSLNKNQFLNRIHDLPQRIRKQAPDRRLNEFTGACFKLCLTFFSFVKELASMLFPGLPPVHTPIRQKTTRHNPGDCGGNLNKQYGNQRIHQTRQKSSSPLNSFKYRAT